ncbi:MAG TPA: YeeE/YedE thiosulfate transporter family protein [Myxococcales bacterium]|nr:YeeE/YedE thiosulfate transporter family protein [Myxococcales bacterium]
MAHFTPFASLAGGTLIGLAAAALLLVNGRVAGISGIAAGLLGPERGDAAWRAAFLGGLAVGGLLVATLLPGAAHDGLVRSAPAIAAAGFLVGLGARLANGCTSGHGLCGLSRLSPRSLAAVVCFIGTGAATVFAVNHWFGGVL